MIADSTGAWTAQQAADYAHDIEVLAKAGYLAWVDLTAVGWGDNPAERILREAKVALHYGPAFGAEGAGHVRINLGCSPDVLREAVQRIAALAG